MILAEATVLVVDDEPELLEIFSIWLKRAGATVLRAANGDAALKVLDAHPVHALVSDIRMPVMDGVTLVKTLFDSRRSIPTTIFVSGFGETSPRLLYSLGVEALLSKPLPRNQLVQTLERSLREREELWSEQPAKAAAQQIHTEYQSIEEARTKHRFGLGRGGCFLPSDKPVLDQTIDFKISFASDALTLRGQGIARWHEPKTQCTGVEFTSLDAGSRRWVITQLHAEAPLSFIPDCD